MVESCREQELERRERKCTATGGYDDLATLKLKSFDRHAELLYV
jgi:hypothetical protein